MVGTLQFHTGLTTHPNSDAAKTAAGQANMCQFIFGEGMAIRTPESTPDVTHAAAPVATPAVAVADFEHNGTLMTFLVLFFFC